MCTAIYIQQDKQHILLGRTMDFSFPLNPQLYFVPKDFKWKTSIGHQEIKTQYCFMGIGQDISPITFADGVNEKGFAMVALYFPEYAYYDDVDNQDHHYLNLAATELIQYLLSTCACIDDAIKELQKIKIIGIKDNITNSIAPLHWMMCDRYGHCAVIEKMRSGLHIMENPIGVLSNSPDFRWHMTNLQNYISLSPYQKEKINWNKVTLSPFGQGGGTFGLPGDFTPPSRFIRSAFLKSYTEIPNTDESIMTAFHILENVSIPKGIVITKRNTFDYTQYRVVLDLKNITYSFQSYNQMDIKMIPFPNSYDTDKMIKSLALIHSTKKE